MGKTKPARETSSTIGRLKAKLKFKKTENYPITSRGEGSYNIIGPQGDTLLDLVGDYGFSRASLFCDNSPTCDLLAPYIVIYNPNDGNNDLTIKAQGGSPPYEYSIDGGNTFQADSVFEDLASVNYAIVVKDSTGSCQYEDSLVLFGVTSVEDQYRFNLS